MRHNFERPSRRFEREEYSVPNVAIYNTSHRRASSAAREQIHRDEEEFIRSHAREARSRSPPRITREPSRRRSSSLPRAYTPLRETHSQRPTTFTTENIRARRTPSYNTAGPDRGNGFSNHNAAFTNSYFASRYDERQNMAVVWTHIVRSNHHIRGQRIVTRIVDIGPPQRRDPETTMLESLNIPTRNVDVVDPEELLPPPTKHIIVIPFRVFKGKVISSIDWERRYSRTWTDSDFASYILQTHWKSHSPAFYYLTKVKFLYYITASYVNVGGKREIKITYTDVLPYRGPRTISRFMYHLHSKTQGITDWTLRFHDVASGVRNADAEQYIMVEIIESLDTWSIIILLLVSIAVSLATGIAGYGIPTKDWGGAFSLSSLIVACLALLLALFALHQYLGMERLIDDDIGNRVSGSYRTHEADDLLEKRLEMQKKRMLERRLEKQYWVTK